MLDEAVSDVESILTYLSLFYPGTPQKFLNDLELAKENLATSPYIYPVYENDSDYRKLVLSNHIIFYTVNDEKLLVEIHRIIRASWNIPAWF
jgi:plasmid stabilization system protein ParE